ncbi:hypothetical protein [Pedobacter frigoris]|uniref:hypothetical protein n=1 Tax=Pedobacter frigoris TaxID=2571272 RepID=UPI0029315247|nr:hypothetical protein [Pedobacter frigoris]
MKGLISPSRYHSITPITEKMAIELASMPALETIQFHDVKPTPATLNILNDIVFKNRKDITLRVYGYSGRWQDIGMLKLLPELEKFDWDSDTFQSVQPLYELKKLTHLGIGFANPKPKISVKFLADFKDTLTSLNMEGDYKDFLITVPVLKKLTKVWFFSMKLTGFDFLEGLAIETLGNYGGRVASFDFLSNLKTLKNLWIKTNSKIEDINFITDLPLLEKLELYYLSKITTFPKCNHLLHLKEVLAFELNRLNDIEELRKLKNCKVTACGKQVPDKGYSYDPGKPYQ